MTFWKRTDYPKAIPHLGLIALQRDRYAARAVVEAPQIGGSLKVGGGPVAAHAPLGGSVRDGLTENNSTKRSNSFWITMEYLANQPERDLPVTVFSLTVRKRTFGELDDTRRPPESDRRRGAELRELRPLPEASIGVSRGSGHLCHPACADTSSNRRGPGSHPGTARLHSRRPTS